MKFQPQLFTIKMIFSYRSRDKVEIVEKAPRSSIFNLGIFSKCVCCVLYIQKGQILDILLLLLLL